MRTEIGKIKNVNFGHGGYQDVMIGITFDLGSDGWGVTDFWGEWSTEVTEYTKWTDESRITKLGETVMRISQLLKDAKVDKVNDLNGIPIEVSFDGNILKSWRILTEVI